ncbi:MAG: 5'-methylthioadenosine/adenosylhomocysteine nucleosidase [Planctomycetes bacterium]|nr:5'-methylthioadenosine/adenosylhomocysteine nucleosidase [Planctomycetota bacterium]
MRQGRIWAVVCVLIILLGGSCDSTLRREEPVPNCEPVTAILGAFKAEVELLQDELSDQQDHQIEGIKFVTGSMSGRPVVIVWTGIGKVNAAMTTTLLIEHFKLREVIFTGIAGGVNPNLQPGDIVIAHKTAYHDMGTVWPEGLFFKGVKNRLTGLENPVFFAADEELLELAQEAAGKAGFRKIETVAGERSPAVIKGVVVTGDVFVASDKKCEELRKRLNADAVEMEGAAVAQICYQRQIPHLVIRSISDKADAGAMVDKQMFYIMAAQNSSSLVSEIVRLLASESNKVPSE